MLNFWSIKFSLLIYFTVHLLASCVSGRTKKTTLQDGVVPNSWWEDIAGECCEPRSRYCSFVYVPQNVVKLTLVWTQSMILEPMNMQHTVKKILSAAIRLLVCSAGTDVQEIFIGRWTLLTCQFIKADFIRQMVVFAVTEWYLPLVMLCVPKTAL